MNGSGILTNDCHIDLRGEDPQSIRREAQLIREGYPDFILYGQSEKPSNDEKVVAAAEEQLKECPKLPMNPLFCTVEP